MSRSLGSAALAFAIAACVAGRAVAQTAPPLVGPARDIARAALIDPVVFDPLLTLPLSTLPQATIESYGRDVSGTVHLGVRNGDDSYAVTLSGPLSNGDGNPTVIDQRAVRGHTFLGIDLTNMIWRPKAKPALAQQLGSDGLLRLSRESRDQVARTIATTDAVDAPWAVFMNFSYKFSRDEYTYTDASTSGRGAETHLNDTAAALVGAALFMRPDDPGYFVGLSYTYSAVFQEADESASVQTRPPVKVRGNLLRIELRRSLKRARLGIHPSWTYDLNSRVTTVDAATYLMFAPLNPQGTKRSTRLYAGVRAGHQTGSGGWFATAFVGPVFGANP